MPPETDASWIYSAPFGNPVAAAGRRTPWNPNPGVSVPFLALVLVIAAAGAPVHVVKTAHNEQLDRTIVVKRKGLSMYSLSAETRGRFVCTDSACLSLWKPLVIAKGKRPVGVPKLGTVKRPNGKTQVTYRGRPLYRFVEDRAPGDIGGEGFRDVGVWRVARVPG
jgi:predicted lipoprotein with Yx(FWY)xxD motif